jgi:hypothetical protein
LQEQQKYLAFQALGNAYIPGFRWMVIIIYFASFFFGVSVKSHCLNHLSMYISKMVSFDAHKIIQAGYESNVRKLRQEQ